MSIKICRLCICCTDVTLTLRNWDWDDKTFLEKLNEIAPGILEDDNKLPNGICTTCIKELNIAYKFIRKCSASQATLKLNFKRNKRVLKPCSPPTIDTNIIIKSEPVNCNNEVNFEPFSFVKVEHLENEEFIPENNEYNTEENSIKMKDKVFKIKEEPIDDEHEINFEKESTDLPENSEYNTEENSIEMKDKVLNIKEEPIDDNEINFEKESTDLPENSEYNTEENSIEMKDKVLNIKEEPIDDDNEINFENESTDFLEENIRTEEINPNLCDDKKNNHNEIIEKITLRKPGTNKNEIPLKSSTTNKAISNLENKSFICEICEKVCKNKFDLKIHSKTHKIDDHYKCKFCNEEYRFYSQMVIHFRKHKTTHIGKRHKCEQCSKTFMYNSLLISHYRTHSNEKAFKCHICGRVYTHQGSLTSHIREHSSEKKYKCDQCDKAFAKNFGLKYHMYSHFREQHKNVK